MTASTSYAMRREDLPPAWGGPSEPIHPPQQHQLAEFAEFGKRTLRHLRHENDTYYLVQFPLAKVLQLRYDIGVQRAATLYEEPSTRELRRLAASLMFGRLSCGCVGWHHWFCETNWRAQNDYEAVGQ